MIDAIKSIFSKRQDPRFELYEARLAWRTAMADLSQAKARGDTRGQSYAQKRVNAANRRVFEMERINPARKI